MNTLHFPWLETAILLPMLGAVVAHFRRSSDAARRDALLASGLTLLATVGAWQDFYTLHARVAHDRWDVVNRLAGVELLVVDELSAPLLPLAALIYLLTELATLKTKTQRFSFPLTLISEAILLATFSCTTPWALVVLLALGTVPMWVELRRRGKPTGVYVSHMMTFVLLMFGGQALVSLEGGAGPHSFVAVTLLMVAVLLRSGIVPVHCWMTDLFEHASFGSALLFVTPMVGAYGAVRLILPIAPDWGLRSIATVSLITAVYSVGMALVQKEGRRFFCYLLLSHSSLVLVGLEIGTPTGLTGALLVWLSIGLAMTGFGLTLRSIESRAGRLSLTDFHGMYEHTPGLAAFFLLTGLASIGFPGTIGFVAVELLVEGASQAGWIVATAVVLASALSGIAVMHAYFRIFTGRQHLTSISMLTRPSERAAILALTALIIGGGLIPQPGVATRYHAAMEIFQARQMRSRSSDRSRQHVSTLPPGG